MASHRVLLTGANGFLASHILSQLLSSSPSHSVRAIVRSESKVNDLRALFPNVSEQQLDYAVVPDMTIPGAFDEALKSNPPFDMVMHTASPFLFKAADSVDHFLQPAIKGTTEILNAVSRVASSTVKRVILTSSFAAIGAFGLTDERNKIYTEEDWNPIRLEDIQGVRPAYMASKTFAERAAWEIAKAQSSWELVVLNPPIIYGPLAHKIKSLDELNESNARFYTGFLKPGVAELPPNGLPLYVDVRDSARAHLLAMDAPRAGNQRFLTTPGLVTSQEIADILRAKVSGAQERVPRGEPGKDTLPEDAWRADAKKATEVLGLKYTSKEDTIADLGKYLLGLEKELGVA